jgi:hypothetical protein
MAGRAIEDERDDWLLFVEGIIADNEDPENQHRVRLVIPSVDENRIYDKWAKQMVPFVGPPGYGSFFPPEKGSEVVVCGRLGQKHTLYYMSVFNEDFVVPPDFDSPAVCGVRSPADMKFIAEGDLQLRAGGMQLETDGAMNVIAPGGFFVNGRPV